MASAETGAGSSFGVVIRHALLLPLHPRKSYSVLRKNPNLKMAIAVVVVFSVFYSLSKTATSEAIDLDDKVQVAIYFLLWLGSSIIGFLVLVLFSNILMRGLSRTRSKYTIFANLLAYWFGWRSIFSSILVTFNPTGEVMLSPFSLPEFVLLVIGLIVFAWSLWQIAVAYSVEESTPLRDNWFPALVALVVPSYLFHLLI